MNAKLVAILLLVSLATVFIVQNVEVVEVRFLFWKLAMSRAFMYIFLVLIGIAVGWLVCAHTQHKRRTEESNGG